MKQIYFKKPSLRKRRIRLIGQPGFLVIAFSFSLSILNAQQVQNVTGGTGTIGGSSFSYSVGEMVLVSTVEISNFYFTQGVLQNDDATLNLHNNQYLSEGLTLYPNPAANIIFLEASFKGGGELDIQLIDLQGRYISHAQIELHTAIKKQSIDISMLQAGTYLLQATLKQKNRIYKHSFKLVKHTP